jgi:hypothetical protein
LLRIERRLRIEFLLSIESLRRSDTSTVAMVSVYHRCGAAMRYRGRFFRVCRPVVKPPCRGHDEARRSIRTAGLRKVTRP